MTKKLILGMVVSASVLTACSGKNEDQKTTMKVDSVAIEKDGSLGPKEKAEKLALAAEQLMSPTGFMYADEVAQVALTYDSKNERARLVHALVGPTMQVKGIMVRIKPVMERDEKGKEEYKKALEEIKKWPNLAVKNFVLDGKPDIKTEADIQKFMDQMTAKYESLRQTLKDIRNTEMVLHLPQMWQGQAWTGEAGNCQTNKVGEGQYETSCDYSEVQTEVKANVADFDALRQIVAGIEVYQILLNSYRYDGAIEVGQKYRDSDEQGRVIYQELLKNKAFGTLRSATAMKSILAMGLDGLAGVRWAQQRQQELCKNGMDAQDGTNRPGYVFKNGICVKQDSEVVDNESGKTLGDVLQTVELALRGNVISQKFENSETGREIVSNIRPAALFDSPIRDVRSIGPISYDNCGRVAGFGDASLGGIFVDHDVNYVIAATKESCGK